MIPMGFSYSFQSVDIEFSLGILIYGVVWKNQKKELKI